MKYLHIMKKKVIGYYINGYKEQDHHIKTIIGLICAALISFTLLDERISKFFMFLRISKSSEFMIGFSSVVTILFFLIMISIFIYRYKKGLNIVTIMWISLFTAFIAIVILKLIIFRARPYIGLNISFVGYSYIRSSFPGGAGVFFAVTPFLWKLWKYDTFFVLTPLIIHAISSVYVGQNYLSDVLAGIAIAYFIGYKILHKTEKNLFTSG